MYLQMAGSSTLTQLLRLIERFLPGQSQSVVAGLMAGCPPSVTAQQSHEMHQLALLAASHPTTAAWLRSWAQHTVPEMAKDWPSQLPVGSPFTLALVDFLERYGHRGVYESHLQIARWREDPTYVFRQMAMLMDLDPQTRAERQRQAQNEAQVLVAKKLPWWARALVTLLVKKSAAEQNDREAGRSSVTAVGEIARQLLLETGRRLVERGYLSQASEVFHLAKTDLLDARSQRRSAQAIQNLVRDRQSCCAKWEAMTPPDLVEADGTIASMNATSSGLGPVSSGGMSWRGVPVGSGIARGRARIIRHPDDAHSFEKGQILVAPSTDPAWTPLFLNAAGLVMETGGYISHGAIVAREFGLPAVVNIPGILTQIPEGVDVEVNGNEGSVKLL